MSKQKLAHDGLPDGTQKLANGDWPDVTQKLFTPDLPDGFPDEKPVREPDFPEDAIDEGDLANIMDEIEQEAAEDAAIAAYESQRKVDEGDDEPETPVQ